MMSEKPVHGGNGKLAPPGLAWMISDGNHRRLCQPIPGAAVSVGRIRGNDPMRKANKAHTDPVQSVIQGARAPALVRGGRPVRGRNPRTALPPSGGTDPAWSATDLAHLAVLPVKERNAAAAAAGRSSHLLRRYISAWRRLPDDVRADAIRERWTVNRVQTYAHTLRCADVAGVTLPPPTIRGTLIDERVLMASAVQPCLLARLRRLLATPGGRKVTGKMRRWWLAGALSMASGELIDTDEIPRYDHPARAGGKHLRSAVERMQHVDQRGRMPRPPEVKNSTEGASAAARR